MRAPSVVLAVLMTLWAPASARAGTLCGWTGLCLYQSPGFTVTIVDAESGTPLSGVYGWAEWTQYGPHGRGGPLMVQDATSGPDGRLAFPGWGPTFGSTGGLLLGYDPAVILFRPGYVTLLVQNGVPLGASQHAMARGMSRNGHTLRLERFRGTDMGWLEQLGKLVFPALSYGLPDADRVRFRALYLRRLDQVVPELSKMASDDPELVRFRSSLELDRTFITGGRR